MLSVRNCGGGSSDNGGLTLDCAGMYYDTGSTSGVAMETQKFNGWFTIVITPKSFLCYEGYTEITVDPIRQ